MPLLFLLIWGATEWYKIPDQKAQQPAADFTGQLATGETLKLSDFRGQWVLLHFWGSWCGPCRAHNRHLVHLYQKHKSPHWTIISAGMETNQVRWLNAIQTDGLVWPHHISDLKRLKDAAALAYGVREIPATFLIDPQGEVVEVNPSIDELDALLTAVKTSQ